jgi:acetyltransferase-like isoleucine patch superfamily enzyme
MFERYTEKARRVIFFARYEASQFGAPLIETEHLLLGLLREDKALTNRFLRSEASVESIRRQIEGHTTIREKISTSVDLPLSNECTRVLAYAAEEAMRLAHNHIGSEHLLLGLLREEGCFAADILGERGVRLDEVRKELVRITQEKEGKAEERVPTRARARGSLQKIVGRLAELDEETLERMIAQLIEELPRITQQKPPEQPGKAEAHGALRKLIERLIDLDETTLERMMARLIEEQAQSKQNAAAPAAQKEAEAVAQEPAPAAGSQRIDLYKVRSTTPLRIKLLRALWHCFQLPFFEHTPRMLSPLRIFLLRLFGAKIGPACQIDCGVKIWIPWNLKMGARSAIGFNAEVYNFAPVEIGDHVVVSQRSYLCTATHDHAHPHFPLVSAPIAIGSQAWVAAGVFIAPGVTIGEGAVIGACSVVTRSMPPWMVCAGNPCRPLKPRVIKPVAEERQ